jgi:hypothetical protein
LRWKADKPAKVLYLDGEMPAPLLQQRLRRIDAASDLKPPQGYFRLLTPDLQENGVTPNLATMEGQAAIDAHLESDTRLIVIDNLSALVRSRERENDAESWHAVADWVLPLRARGFSVLFVHHDGKNGSQRGTSKREDLLDAVVHLKHPLDYTEREGARFEIHFEKARGLLGEDVTPIEATLTTDSTGREFWTHRHVEDATMTRLVELVAEGANQTDTAEALRLSRHQVSRLRRKAHEAGKLDCPTWPKGGANCRSRDDG